MVDQDAVSHRRIGVNIDTEDLGGAHLDEIGHVAPTLVPDPMADAIALQRLETLEEEQRLDIAVAGRIPLIDRHDVSARRGAERTILGKGGIGDLTQDELAHLGRGELLRDPIAQRPLEAGVMQDTGWSRPDRDWLSSP